MRPLPRSGFTLIELMVALAIFAGISVLTWQSMAGALNARDVIAFEDEFDRTARTATGRGADALWLPVLC